MLAQSWNSETAIYSRGTYLEQQQMSEEISSIVRKYNTLKDLHARTYEHALIVYAATWGSGPPHCSLSEPFGTLSLQEIS